MAFRRVAGAALSDGIFVVGIVCRTSLRRRHHNAWRNLPLVQVVKNSTGSNLFALGANNSLFLLDFSILACENAFTRPAMGTTDFNFQVQDST